MNSGVKAVIATVVFITLALAALVAWRNRQKPEGDSKDTPQHYAVTVDVAPVEMRTVSMAVHVTGEVESPSVVDITSKVGGKLESLKTAAGTPLKEGDLVRAGDLVATIEHSQLDAMLAQAEAALKVANAGLEQATVAEAHMLKERERVETLLKEGSATVQQRDQAVAGHDSAVAAVKLAKSQVEQADAMVRLAKLNQAEALVTTPISGVITTRYVDEGNLVGPARPLLRISQADVMKITGELAESHLPFLVPGKTMAEITVDTHPGITFTGVVSVVRPDISRATRTVRVEVSVQNPDGLLKPGMFARLRIFTRRSENVAAIPGSALASDATGSIFVYVARNGTAVRQAVRLGISDGTVHEVTSGLKAGDVVVLRGKESLADGSKITVPGDKAR